MSTTSTSIIVRPATDADAHAIAQTVTAAFGRDDESRLVAALAASGDVAASFVAESNGTVIGHVLFSRLEAQFPALALAPVSVRPEHQRRSVGSALIEHGLSWASDRDWTAVFVLGEPEYYGRFGFTADAARGYDCPYSGPYLMARFLRPANTLADSLAGHLTYPAPFSALG